eukprot:TRINITY_DN20503_c0_g1_i1.p1 TRINITY_DN20503_c0_g1~~TRINITY_DN20503_c0_g1_i1.p1  ORF type:complete len:404 (-),score=58.88 TRINITY_DN20503_c0_g1_i1:70-1215(-)
MARPLAAMDSLSASDTGQRRKHVTQAIETVVLRLLRQLALANGVVSSETARGFDDGQGVTGGVPEIELSAPCHSLVTEDGEYFSGTSRRSRVAISTRNYRRLARLFAALDAVHRLNVTGRTATQRELFYRANADGEGQLFREQQAMDHAIRDVSGTLCIGRPRMGVFTTEKGRVAGTLRFFSSERSGIESGRSVTAGAAGIAIGEPMLQTSAIEVGSARCILVVEKDTFFQHLLQWRLLEALPLVLVTGRGYPDLLTRRLLQRLVRVAPELPLVYMGDYDPHGVNIYLTYRASCPTLRWLGLHAGDTRNLPPEASMQLTRRDLVLRDRLLKQLAALKDDACRAQLLAMERKFELEALHAAHGADGVALRFVPEKILGRSWI